ncbi:MAG: GTP-binding protein [Bacteroidaceae bacterium]|nr:GTP-binding protein [Bacteroidaceae bacterium]
MKHEVPVLLLTGYLGSGKTTLVNHILTNQQGIKFAVIVNDIGEVNIDARLLQKNGMVDMKDESLIGLENGCICCSLKMNLVEQLADIVALHRFDYIVIEASGICEPAPIASTIYSIPTMGEKYNHHGSPRLDCVVTVVDALRMASEFGCGDRLRRHGIDEDDIESLVIQQMEFCDIILLNKVSEVSADDLGRIRRIVRSLQPKAEIIECDYADVPLESIINTGRFNMVKAASSAGWVEALNTPLKELEEKEHHHHEHEVDEHEEHEHHKHGHEHHHEHAEEEHGEHGHHGHHHHHHDHEHSHMEEYGISTFVYYRRPPFSLHAFDKFVAMKWSPNIIRAKGVCYFDSDPDVSYMFEQAGVQKKLTDAGMWYATASEEELAQYFKEEPGLLEEWDDTYGDRMQKIVFIGQNMDREQIERDLDACLKA